MLGVVFTLISAIGFGAAAVFAKLATRYVHSSTTTFFSVLVGAFVSFAIVIVFQFDAILTLTVVAFAWFTFSAFVNFILGRYLNYTSVDLIGVTKATPIVASSPFFAAILAITIGGESMNIPLALGTLSIVAGLIIILSKHEQN